MEERGKERGERKEEVKTLEEFIEKCRENNVTTVSIRSTIIDWWYDPDASTAYPVFVPIFTGKEKGQVIYYVDEKMEYSLPSEPYVEEMRKRLTREGFQVKVIEDC